MPSSTRTSESLRLWKAKPEFNGCHPSYRMRSSAISRPNVPSELFCSLVLQPIIQIVCLITPQLIYRHWEGRCGVILLSSGNVRHLASIRVAPTTARHGVLLLLRPRQPGVVLDAVIECPLVSWPLAALVDAAFATAVGPAKTFRHCDLVAVCVAALGATSVAPTEPSGFCSLGAVFDLACCRSACVGELI